MRPADEFQTVRSLVGAGLNDCQVGRLTGIPRGTVREWRLRSSPPGHRPSGQRGCFVCHGDDLDQPAYAYLLGLYLGDGFISAMRRGVFRLRVVLDVRYPGIIEECATAIGAVGPRSAAVQQYSAKHYAEVHSGWSIGRACSLNTGPAESTTGRSPCSAGRLTSASSTLSFCCAGSSIPTAAASTTG